MVDEDNKTKLDPKEIERSRRVVLDYISGKTLKHKSIPTQGWSASGGKTPASPNASQGRQEHPSASTSKAVRAGENMKILKQESNSEKSEIKKDKVALINLRSDGLPLASLFKKTETRKIVGPKRQAVQKTEPAGNKNYFNKDKIGKYRVIFLTIILALLIILLVILLSETANL